MARLGPLYESLPCYSAPEINFRTPSQYEYVEKRPAEHFNLRTNVRYDRNWGRSAWAVPAVQQYRPMDIVDEAHKYHNGAVIHWPYTEYLPIFYESPYVQPYRGCSYPSAAKTL